MFLTITDDIILQIREKNYPLLTSFSLKSAIFKTSGTDTLCDLDINVIENTLEPKILNKNDKKNNLKFKIFQISSSKMRDELLLTKNIEQIEEINKKYGIASLDLFASVDFIGSKTDLKDHYVENDNVSLSYQKKLIFREKEFKFLSLGMIFYYNLEDFIAQTGVTKDYITPETLSTSLKIIDIFDENGKNVNEDIVQDLRTVNKIFKTNEILDKINEKINIQNKITKILSETKNTLSSNQFFSDLYHSRDSIGNSNILFYMDYNKIIQNYSFFSKILKDSPFTTDLQSKCKISSIKIVRRQLQYNKENPTKYYLKKIPVDQVITTSQKKEINSLFIEEKNDDFAFIREIDLFEKYRTIEVSDKTLYKLKNSYFQYGIELIVSDGFVNYLSEINKSLIDDLKIFNSYLNETNNIVKTQNNNVKNHKLTIGYYDPLVGAFTKRFAEEVFPVIYEQNLTTAVSNFVNAAKLFGLIDAELNQEIIKTLETQNNNLSKKATEEELVSSLLSLLSPISANTSTINYFIKLYEKLILQIERVLKDKTNSVFSLEHWFEKTIIDSSENPSIGYGFFNSPQKISQFPRVSNQTLEEKISKDILEYIKNNSINEINENLKYSSISPEYINGKSKKISLNNIRAISNDDFIDLELDIKRFNSLGNEEKEIFIDDTINSKPVEKQKLILKTEKLINNFSFVTKNLFLNLDDVEKIKLNSSEVGEQQNNSINPEILFLGMLKNTKIKPKFNKVPKIFKLNKFGIFEQRLFKDSINLPFQISSLIQKNDPFFSDSNVKYLSNLENNSKYLFLYNTIHQIEIKLSKDIKDSSWVLLTKTVYDSLAQNKKYLCRLKLFSDSSIDINFFEEISLPIYDKHFILEKNVSQEQIQQLIEKFKKTYYYNLLDLKTKLIFNKIPKTFKILNVKKNITPASANIVPRLSRKAREKQTIRVDLPDTNITKILSTPATKLSPVIQASVSKIDIKAPIAENLQNIITNSVITPSTVAQDADIKKSSFQEIERKNAKEASKKIDSLIKPVFTTKLLK